MTTELVARDDDGAAYGLELAEEIFTPERREAISKFLSIDAENPAFLPFLAISARYGLDPMTGEIWLIPQQGGKYRPAAGRDGYLKIARRNPQYKGMRCDVVHARDSFKVRTSFDAETGEASLSVFHEYPDLADVTREFGAEEGFSPARYRGPVIGAWAIAYFEGREPFYYYASIEEHGKTKESSSGRKSWQGSWSYTSAMILKAAQSYVLRIASGTSGIVPVDETVGEGAVVDGGAERTPEAIVEAELPEWVPEDYAERLAEAIDRSRNVDANLWNEAKLSLYFGGLKEVEDVDALIARIDEETSTELERQAEVVEAEVVE